MPRTPKPIDELSRTGIRYRTDEKCAAKMKERSKQNLLEKRVLNYVVKIPTLIKTHCLYGVVDYIVVNHKHEGVLDEN